ncbi:MAG: hypothetical protein R3F62_06400 [Planctomycetota bacterium]
MRPRFQLPPLLARLHQKIEFHDEYERPQRGFFIAELDRREGGDAPAQPILLYVTPESVHGPPVPGPRPPDWVADAAGDEAHDEARITAFAARGVKEHWRVSSAPDGGTRIECRFGVDPGLGRYTKLEVFQGSQPVRSPTFPDLRLLPQDLDG